MNPPCNMRRLSSWTHPSASFAIALTELCFRQDGREKVRFFTECLAAKVEALQKLTTSVSPVHTELCMHANTKQAISTNDLDCPTHIEVLSRSAIETRQNKGAWQKGCEVKDLMMRRDSRQQEDAVGMEHLGRDVP